MDDFDAISLEQLRKRKSEKWSTYPPDVLPAFVAEMDFALAPPVRQALESAIGLGDVGYASSTDVPAAFASFARERFGWTVDENSVFAVPDVMAGLAETLQVFTAPAAPIVINPPVYPPFFDVIRHEGRTVVEVPLCKNTTIGWFIDFERTERAFAEGAQAYLLCSPHNPVGRVWTEAELRTIASLCRRYRVLLISDEIHAPLAMPGVDFVPCQNVAMDLPCVTLSSASKAFNIPGLKCAVLAVAPTTTRDTLRARLCARPDEIESRIGHLGVIATVAAFRDGAAWLDSLRTYLDGNRRLLADLLRRKIPQARYSLPDATFLAWVDCTSLHLDGDPARQFLDRGRVALEPGSRFGKESSPCVRLNMGTSRSILTEIVERMAAAL